MAEIILTEGMPNTLEVPVNEEMIKAIKHFEHELTSIRTGRAHPSMVDTLKISCYAGTTELPLKNLANISVPDARMIIIQPWDQSTLMDIERALKESDLGVTPQTEGQTIRIILADMSVARRDELKKILAKKTEECRVSIRNIRKNFNNLIRDTHKEKEISEDFAKRLEDTLQKLTDKYIKQTDQLSEKKEADLKG